METAAEIEARLRADHPTITIIENGIPRTLSALEYEAQISEWVAATLALETRQQDRADARSRRDQFVTGMGRLRSNLEVLRNTSTTDMNWSAMTAAQRTEATRVGLADATQAIIWLGGVLGELRQDEP